MHVEFIVQRMRTLPRNVVRDFSCESLMMPLARISLVAIIVAFIMERFHWFKNHVWCSKAMNPDCYSPTMVERWTLWYRKQLSTAMRPILQLPPLAKLPVMMPAATMWLA